MALLCWLVLVLLLPGCVQAEAVDVSEGWEYRWGDSPFDTDGVPLWTLEPDDSAWTPIAFPSNPPGREGRENVWYRVVLPEGQWRDPVLYIFSVDLIVQVYQGGRQIYGYGQFDEAGRGRFAGWPWHMISLPEYSQGEPLYFRVFSDYFDIGLWGEVRVMERVELLRYVIDNSLLELLIGGFSLLIAVLALLALPIVGDRQNILAVMLLAGSAGGMAIGTSQARLLLLDHALLWDYLAAASYFITPIAMALLLEPWFAGRVRRLYQAVMLFFVTFLLVAAIRWSAGAAAVSDTYPVFDLLFVISLPLLLGPALGQFRRVDNHQRAILVAFGVHSLVLLESMAVAHGLLDWKQVSLSGGALVFCLVIVAASLHRYARVRQALEALNHSLEAKVSSRTAELQAYAQQERKHVQVLEFERHKRRQLEQIISALHRCPSLTEALGLLQASLPGLCSPLEGALYLPAADVAGYRRACHWGRDEQRFAAHRWGFTEAQPRASYWVFALEVGTPGVDRPSLGWLELSAEKAIESDWSLGMLRQLMQDCAEKISLTLSVVGLQEELGRFSYEDSLTGLKNRRYLDDRLQAETARARVDRVSLAVMVCDIDHFKVFNDTHGHAAGDEVLCRVADQLRGVFRQTDVVCRYGGEEFVIIMLGASLESCLQRAENLRQSVGSMRLEYDGRDLGHVTLSTGVAAYPELIGDPAVLMEAADQALFLAKRLGRNRIETAADARPAPQE